ncbi:phospholipase A [Psychrosphaera ytuae]|uniref:Phospholipase A1 n=1 Tax=Psychrosphaera ytuae TaxID=2820710 RepID=A0A975DB70_9GAMM|nr:phospholipase A [Psychrosphaera ytuae]QTH63549.1 phospholipase A [Psychrosphaera ytuae]
MTKGTVFTLTLFCGVVSFQTYSQASNDQTDSTQTASPNTDRPNTSKASEILHKKERLERRALANPFTLLQHRRNYILPVTYATNPSSTAVQGLTPENIDNFEAKFQLSIKMPIFNQENGSGLYAAFTAVSFWQVYNADASKPFRETDYEPEVFYSFKNEYELLGVPFNELRLGFNHQSNGQDLFNSRSWNRLYVQALIDIDDTYYALKVWWRIPENEKDDELDPTGDDNPDITDYLGNFEFEVGHQYKHYHFFAKWRNNLDFSENRGAIELNFNYQFTEKYKVLIQYFNGYGDSLIDYNRHQQRLGIGVQLNFI